MGQLKKLAICIAVATMVAIAGANEDSVARTKRQIPYNPVPTFPPDVERTSDGVPILEESYLDRQDRPAARFFAQFESPNPTGDSEGLRLYEDLWSTRGRNEPRSLDHASYPFGENGIQPHHRQSAAWSTRKETKRFSSSRSGKSIQVRSGGTQAADDDLPVELIPSGFGASTGPKFSEEVTYRRSNGGRRSGNLQTKSLVSGQNGGFSCVTCSRRSSSSSGDLASSASSNHQLTRSLDHDESSGASGQTEGLRLYNKWLSQSSLGRSSVGRNQLRSLDNDNEEELIGTPLTLTNGIQPHHRNSGSWSKREERRHSSRRSSKTITVRSGGNGATSDLPAPAIVPSGFGESTGPKFSEEVTYRRNGGATQTRSLNSGVTSSSRRSNGNGVGNTKCVLCRTSNSPSASQNWASNNQVRSLHHDDEEAGHHEEQTWNAPQQHWAPRTTPVPMVITGGDASGARTHHSESWSENEERNHHQSQSSSSSNTGTDSSSQIGHVPNGGEVRITDLENRGDITAPHHESEEISYRRQASGGRSSGSGAGANGGRAGCIINNNGQSNSDSSSSTATTRLTNCTRTASRRRTNGHHQSSSSDNSALETRTLESSASSAAGGAAGASSNLRCQRCQTRGASSSRHQTRQLEYPPVQTVGHGDQQVDARILHSTDDHHQEENNGESQSTNGEVQGAAVAGGKKIKKGYYRRTVFKNYTTQEIPPTLQTWLY